MEVILLEKIANLGNVGDKVKVKSGYARNYLLPFQKAVTADEENIAKFEVQRAELEKVEAEKLVAAQKRAELFKELILKIEALASEEGKLFGSVGPREIVEAAEEKGIQLEKSEIDMPEGAIRQAGEYKITVHFHSDVSIDFQVNIIAKSEGAS